MAISPCLDSGLRRNDEESRNTQNKQSIRVGSYAPYDLPKGEKQPINNRITFSNNLKTYFLANEGFVATYDFTPVKIAFTNLS